MPQASGARDRILKSAKALFASNGYEFASTSAIARSAGTSESQLVKYFGSKAGLLEAIFYEAWKVIFDAAQEAAGRVETPTEKLQAICTQVLSAIDRDPELKMLFLLEGRRLRKQNQSVALSQSFLEFIGLIDSVLAEMQAKGMFRPRLNLQAIRSALIGMLEGLLRDHYLYEKMGYPAAYNLSDLPGMLETFLQSFMICKTFSQNAD